MTRDVSLAPEFIAAVVYGITTFIVAIEAGTVPLTLPFAIVVSVLLLVRWRKQLRSIPIAAFFGPAYLIAAILILGWGLYFRGFPQFSDLGIIH